MNCDPSAVAAAATCYDRCIPPGMQAAVQTYLLAQILFAVTGNTSTDPAVLAKAASNFITIKGFEAEVQAYLLCQIATAVGA